MTAHQVMNILQYNVQKSRDVVLASLFRDPDTANYDVLVIQEPWRNPYIATSYHPLKDTFYLAYPDDKAARVCFYINRRIDPSTWTISYSTKDIMILQIDNISFGNKVHIVNVYNEVGTHTLTKLRDAIDRLDQQDEVLMLGDFNLHHPLWTSIHHLAASGATAAQALLTVMQDFHFQLLTIPGAPTHRWADGESTIDLTFATEGLTSRMLYCKIDSGRDCDSDHLPITTAFAWEWTATVPIHKRQWARMDVPILQQTLKKRLPEVPTATALDGKYSIDQYVEAIVNALQAGIEASTPWSNPSPRSVPGFDRECKDICREVQKLRRLWQKTRLEDDYEAYRRARNRKGRSVKRILRDNHRQRVTEASASDSGLWKLVRWAKNRHVMVPTCTPELRKPDGGLAQEASEKAETLRQSFFPPPPTAELLDTADYEYPEAIECPEVTTTEIVRAVRAAAPNKAPGTDGITNKVLHESLDILLPSLHGLFNTCMLLGYCPAHFKETITVALRKPGKDDYTEPKAYRPIALLNTLGKALESIIASRLTYLADTHQLLPSRHTGGRKLASTDHAIHLLLQRIHKAWADGQVASLLLLDVSGAFDNVCRPRLLHNLRKRRINETLVRWIESFLSDRSSTLKLQEYTAPAAPIQTGIPQGSPLSPILYLFYNADLIEACQTENTEAVGYIDDVSVLAVGPNSYRNCKTLKTIHRKAENWARQHGSQFAHAKYEMVHFSRKLTANTTHPLRLPHATIEASASCRYLGVHMDSRLHWNHHRQRMEAKATERLSALSTLASSTWGTGLVNLRQVYRAMIVPQMLYSCSAWYTSTKESRGSAMLNTITRVQRRAAHVITGAFRTTAGSAVDVEANLLPVRQQLEQTALESIIRLRTTPLYAEMARLGKNSKARSPLGRLSTVLKNKYRLQLGRLEKRQPYVVPPWWTPPSTHIDLSPEAAVEQHDAIDQDTTLCIYTDGSAIDGHVGAAAIVPSLHLDNVRLRRMEYMGQISTSTVYAAELRGIVLAFQIALEINDSTKKPCKCVVFTDNQAAIKAIANPKSPSGQYILIQAIHALDKLRGRGCEVQLRWIPAHIGVFGNEAADRAAKLASKQYAVPSTNSVPQEELLPNVEPRTTLTATVKTAIRRTMQDEWHQTWDTAKQGRDLYRLGVRPGKRTTNVRTGIHRALSSAITQMRTGKIGLRAYLHSIGIAETDECQCGHGRQTVRHIILECRNWVEERQRMWAGKTPCTSIKQVLCDPHMAVSAAKMLLRTGLLEQFRAVPSHIFTNT